MTLKDIRDVLTFAAFRPEPDNPDSPWQERFHGKRALLLNLSRNHVSWVAKDKRGRVSDAGDLPGEFSDVADEAASRWRDLTDDGWVAVSINHRFVISLEQNLSRKAGWREAIRTNPKVVLGSLYDRSKRYALHHNPDTNSSLLLSADDAMIKAVEGVLRAKGLRPARVACGLFALTVNALHSLARDPELGAGDSLLVTWVEGSICTVIHSRGVWSDLRCRSGLNPEDHEGALSMMRPYFEAREKPARVVLAADEPHGSFADRLSRQFEALHFTELTRPHELWETLSRN